MGLAAALAMARVLRSVLYQVTPTDPATYVVVLVVVLVIAAGACLFPALRAAAVDPTVDIKHE